MTVDTSAEAIGRSIAELMSWLTGPDSGQNDGLVTAANQLAALSAERDQWLTRAAAAVSLLPDDMRVGELQAAVKNLMERDALMPQRDAARTEAALLEVRAQRAEADRDRLAADVARLRGALEAVIGERLSGESNPNVPDHKTVTIAVAWGDLREARAALGDTP